MIEKFLIDSLSLPEEITSPLLKLIKKIKNNMLIIGSFIAPLIIIISINSYRYLEENTEFRNVLCLIFALLITVINARKSKEIKSVFKIYKNLFTDFDFSKSVLRSVAWSVYVMATFAFWFFMSDSIFVVYEFQEFIQRLLLSLGALLGLRIFLELGISISLIAENTDKDISL